MTFFPSLYKTCAHVQLKRDYGDLNQEGRPPREDSFDHFCRSLCVISSFYNLHKDEANVRNDMNAKDDVNVGDNINEGDDGNISDNTNKRINVNDGVNMNVGDYANKGVNENEGDDVNK